MPLFCSLGLPVVVMPIKSTCPEGDHLEIRISKLTSKFINGKKNGGFIFKNN